MKKKSIRLSLLFVGIIFIISGCSEVTNLFKDFKQDFTGLSMVVETYDEDSQLIDRLEGKSVKIERDTKFDVTNEYGDSVKDSKVLSLTIGGQNMTHVGSSLIAYEKGLENVFDDYSQTVDVFNQKRTIPILNSMVNDFKNKFNGKNKTLLIRSQSGYPLATFTGDNVTIQKTEVPSSTNFLIDGKRLFVYRCDYTLYDNKLLLNR